MQTIFHKSEFYEQKVGKSRHMQVPVFSRKKVTFLVNHCEFLIFFMNTASATSAKYFMSGASVDGSITQV